MFQVYESKFSKACLSTPSLPQGVSGKATEAWDDIYGDEEAFTATSGNATGASGSSGLSELSSYLHSDTEVKFGPDFNILNCPASRVLEERRRRLTPDMVEVLSCIKDWELANLHKQHTVEKETKELEVAFEAMHLNDAEETSPGSYGRNTMVLDNAPCLQLTKMLWIARERSKKETMELI
ncbi:hypothetical protein U9M48_042015 [Paspalum notatum var. saurae]|uniref:Uncharacterized protein n=1 Tax=Paspalum notatum var. saurae TaxID=547442 RepID=A0AAQ3URS0_PASNO